jgi:hypothetical protein
MYGKYLNSAGQRNYMLYRITCFSDLGFRSYYFVIIFNEFDIILFERRECNSTVQQSKN